MATNNNHCQTFSAVARQRIAKAFPTRLQTKSNQHQIVWFIHNTEAEIRRYLEAEKEYASDVRAFRNQRQRMHAEIKKLRRNANTILELLKRLGYESDTMNRLGPQRFDQTDLYRLACCIKKRAVAWEKLWLPKGRPRLLKTSLAGNLEYFYTLVTGNVHGFARVLATLRKTEFVKDHGVLSGLNADAVRKQKSRTKPA
ncbi:MAG: hypothetical protein ACRESX_08350 [Gammaproteobacteria bacterium]